ncbi:MAG: DegQ family serine endoprotease [Sterolibacteriaceae bacterium]|nr:DegQ family serine endoprotease [Sterolibacteriaceae bacterium]MBK9087437.1 DegQ family serine endoprotease [Sterolibacteriaceae bacterium]
MQSRTFKRGLVATAVVAALAGAYAEFGPRSIEHAHALGAPTTAVGAPAAAPAVTTTAAALPDFSAIVERNGPAVVNISVTGTAKTGFGQQSPFPQVDPNDPFSEFFRRFQMPIPQGNAPVRGMGSGFIVSPDGLVLTNAHVIDGADEVTVKLTDKREFKAKVLGVDKLTDVAVLRIDAKNLPVVRLGDAARVRVGEWVLAIGSPFGFENSVTAGIVSAKSRSLPDDGYVPFIQTDVAVNPGNSGGPLINLNGEVVGINSQIYSRSGGYQGVSFAIPIDVAMRVEEQLVQHGKVSHGRLGVTIQEISQPLAESFGLKSTVGGLVSAVENDSPAAKAGVEPGDIILKFNDTPINRSAELPPLVANLQPGTAATLQIWRKGQTKDIKVSVGELASAKYASNTGEADGGRLGLALRPLTSDERRQAEVSGGLLVEDARGAAARAGIQPGDIVLALNGQAVKDVEQFRTLVAKAGKHAALLIERGNAKIFVPVELG